MVFVYHLRSAHFLTFALRTQVDMYLGARTAWTCVAHFPKVIVFVAVDDMARGQVLRPIACCLVVALKPFRGASLEHRCIQTVGVELQDTHEIFPCPSDGFLLEVVAKRPIPQHLEHGVVVCVMTNLFQVVVLAAYTETFLRVRHAFVFGRHIPQDDILKLVHARVGKHQCRVTFHHHGGRRNNVVLLRSEKLFKRLSDLFCCQHNLFVLVS